MLLVLECLRNGGVILGLSEVAELLGVLHHKPGILVEAIAIPAFGIWQPIYGVTFVLLTAQLDQVGAVPLVPRKSVVFEIWLVEHVLPVASEKLAVFVVNGETRVHFTDKALVSVGQLLFGGLLRQHVGYHVLLV